MTSLIFFDMEDYFYNIYEYYLKSQDLFFNIQIDVNIEEFFNF